MFTEVLIATISMQAGRKLDHEIKNKKEKFDFSPSEMYKIEEYSVPQRNMQNESEYIRSINDLTTI